MKNKFLKIGFGNIVILVLLVIVQFNLSMQIVEALTKEEALQEIGSTGNINNAPADVQDLVATAYINERINGATQEQALNTVSNPVGYQTNSAPNGATIYKGRVGDKYYFKTSDSDWQEVVGKPDNITFQEFANDNTVPVQNGSNGYALQNIDVNNNDIEPQISSSNPINNTSNTNTDADASVDNSGSQMDNSHQADNPTSFPDNVNQANNGSNSTGANTGANSNNNSNGSVNGGNGQVHSCAKEGLDGVDFLVFHGPLVPCGVEKKCDTSGMSAEAKKQIESINKTCTLCHFIILIKNIFDLLLSLIITVSLLMLTIAGVLYIISSGGAMTSLAKGIIQKTLLGFGIFLLSWLIVYTVLNLLSVRTGENGGDGMIGKGTADSWFQFTCDTESSFDKDLLDTQTQNPDNTQTQNPDNTQTQNPDNTQTQNPTPPTPTQPSTTEEQARAIVNDNVTIPRDACQGTSSTRATNCVSLVGAKPQAIQGMNSLANGCKSYNPNCVVQVNAVTDRIIDPNTGETYYNTVHSGNANCTYCHHSGDKVDYQANSTLNTYLTGRATRSEIENIQVGSTTSGGILTRIGRRTSPPSGPKFRDVNNNVWVYEAGNGSSGGHWDVCYAGSACPEHSSS